MPILNLNIQKGILSMELTLVLSSHRMIFKYQEILWVTYSTIIATTLGS